MPLTKGEAVFLQAALEGEIAYLVCHIQKVNPKATGRVGYSALMHASENGHLKAVEYLLPYSDANAQNRDGSTALILAAEEGDLACVQALLPHTNPNIQNGRGYTALMAAVAYNRRECAVELARVTNLSLLSKLGSSARHLADTSDRVPNFGALIEEVARAANERRTLELHIEVVPARPKACRL